MEGTIDLTSYDCSQPNAPPSKKLDNFWSRTYYLLVSATLAGGFFVNILWLVGIVPINFWLQQIEAATLEDRKLTAINRLTQTIARISREIKITSQISIEGMNNGIDLFIELPEKQFFIISIRTPGEGEIFYNQDRELICFKRKKGITRYNRPDLISETKIQEHWLRKHRRDLFGGSNKDGKRPATRLLVFAAPTKLQAGNEELYEQIGREKVVKIRNSKGSMYLLLEDQIIEFLSYKTAQN